ncbi:hypothetical protein [Psychrobacter immobilis]|uniref:hypothetical protein n=3 Tax=Psychrobacter immobilis TaxID=498 RepID=UPI00191AA9DB|nr:hypothetical protein [Psychrobacter immobilis]
MTEVEFINVKSETTATIVFLQNRGFTISEIRELVSAYSDLPKQWIGIFSFIEVMEYSEINSSLIENIHRKLSTVVRNNLLYSNKLIKIIDISKDDFDVLLKHYQHSYKAKKPSEYSISELTKEEYEIGFSFDLDQDRVGFFDKKIVNDYVRIDIEDRVDESLRAEFSNIIGLRKVAFPGLYACIFDKKNKCLIVSVDLANIIKSKVLNVEMSKFSIEIKKRVTGLTFPSTSRNLFDKIKIFYDTKEGFAKDFSLKSPDGVIYHAHANEQHPDARTSKYHINGEIGVKGNVSLYRIKKEFHTKRSSQYLIDLKSIAAMTTKPNPFLYEATIMSDSAADFVEAIDKIL